MIMRTILRPFAIHAAYSPIETIVFFSIVGTLAYFQLLNTIKHSAFLAQGSSLLPFGTHQALRPAYALVSGKDAVSAPERVWGSTLEDVTLERAELQQVVWDIKESAPSTLSFITDSELLEAVQSMSDHIVEKLGDGKYAELCYRPAGANASAAPPPCFSATSVTERTFTHTLAFKAGAREEFVGTLAKFITSAPKDVATNVKYDLKQVLEPEFQSIDEMKNGRWVAYAAKAVGSRFWGVMKRTPSLDITLILAGYVLMHVTFALVFVRSRKLGSTVSIPTAIFSSGVLALLLSLSVAAFAKIPMDVVALSEALPFLVCTVGFDKPMRLARAVFTHPYLLTPIPERLPAGTQSRGSISTKAFEAYAGTLLPASEVILSALSSSYKPIMRDYGLEIAVLVIGANSRVAGLKEICALASILLVIDCILMCTFFSAILCVMVEVQRIKAARAYSRSRPASVTNSPSASPQMRPSALRSSSKEEAPEGGSFFRKMRKLKDTIIGVKGGDIGSGAKQQENPVARLKLLLIITFLTLHILNLVAPLAAPRPHSASSQAYAHSRALLNARKVDISTEDVQDTIARFVNYAHEDRLLIKVAPPTRIQVAPPAAIPASRGKSTSTTDPTHGSDSTSTFDKIMSSWTAFVADPLLSKWIVVALALSVGLNGYLLKGIAIGITGKAFPPNKDAGVRFNETKADFVAASVEPPQAAAPVPLFQPTRSPLATSSRPAPPPQPLKLDDLDRKLTMEKRKFSIHSSPLTASTSANNSDGSSSDEDVNTKVSEATRPYSTVLDIFENGPRPVQESLRLLSDEEVVMLAQKGKVQAYALEKVLAGSMESEGYAEGLARAVRIRRALISRSSATKTLEASCIPHQHYDYTRVMGACCENVVGYIPIPLGVAGPLKIDGVLHPIPMATAEGTLVASTSRGCKALNAGGGVSTVVVADAMTRGPAIDFPSTILAAQAKLWLTDESPQGGYQVVKQAFESTSRFARLERLKVGIAGRTLYVRFATRTGDAMGMNMISKGTEKALEAMQQYFPDMIVLALSGNYCTDKKPAAINWIEGRGKSVVAEAIVPGHVVKSVLKTTVESLVNVNIKKNLIGSAMAASVGGFNAHAANILTAVFLATGQDPAQNVESSNCMTLMEATNNGEDLLMTITMPSIEVGTVGGGTILAPQGAVLEMLNLKGAHPKSPGQNAQNLARLIAAAVMAGELSLLSALAAGHLVRAHLVHNRSQLNTPSSSRPVTPSIAAPGGLGTPGGYNFNASASSIPRSASTAGGAGVGRVGALKGQGFPLTPSPSSGAIAPYSVEKDETKQEEKKEKA